jgi:N utilization substance protein A
MSKEIVEAVRGLAAEKNISSEKLMEALEDALLSAYKKTPGSARHAKVEMDRDSADFIVWELKIPPELEERLLVDSTVDQEPTVDPETGEMREPPEPEIDPEKLKEYEDQIEIEDVTPHDFGRIAAQTAKQVILQRIREAERDMMYEEYRDRVGELITGIVQQSDSRYTLVQLRERVEALLPKSEQVDGERYDHSQRIKAVIKDVSNSTKGPSIIVSRRDPELIKQLFELEVPEIADGLVEITGVAREPGYRSKIAVVSHVDGVDPVGACVGPRGSRVRMVVSELRGEKIDIIPYNDEPARFVAKALSPARVREVLVDDAGKQATVIVPDDQLSLAIGREGQNARLAARLTGWRIDIRSETEFAAEEAEHGYDEAEDGGRCHAILANGRRCPNASLAGSRYCGLPTHQALAEKDGDQVEAPAPRAQAPAPRAQAPAPSAEAPAPRAQAPARSAQRDWAERVDPPTSEPRQDHGAQAEAPTPGPKQGDGAQVEAPTPEAQESSS